MAEESKQSGLVSGQSESGRSISNASLEDSFTDLEDSLDFDIYVEDIPLIAEDNGDLSTNATIPPGHFTDSSSENSSPIPLNLRSFKESDNDDYPEIGSKQFTEDDLDDILLKDSKTEQLDEDESIALSASELDNITSDNDDYLYNEEESFESKTLSNSGKSGFAHENNFDAEDLNDTYDTDIGDDSDITLGTDELDHILNPDEQDEEENEFDTKSFFDSESEEEDESIALSDAELNNITNPDDASLDDFETDNFISDPPADLFETNESGDEEIALSGDELNNLLESGNIEDEDMEEEGEAKSFFDSVEEDEDVSLSPDELSNITNADYDEDGIETEDLSTGIESNEYGVSTEKTTEEAEGSEEDENISLSSDELDNILGSGEVEEEEEFDLENAKSFFDSDEENMEDDESISLSADELGNITADQDFEEVDSNESTSSVEDNFDLSDSTQDLEMEASPSLFEEKVEDEEIALSGDELNNLLESGEIETEEADSLGDSLFEGVSEEDESISLSPDELGNITAEEEFELDNTESPDLIANDEDNFDLSESTQDLEMDSSPSLFEEKIDDEEIALSGDELNNLLESGEIQTEEAESLGDSFFEDSSEEDDSISLSPDELGNITSGEDFEVQNVDSTATESEDNFDLPDSSDEIEFDTPANLFGENLSDDEEISLSGDELSNLLESGDIESEEADSIPTDYSNPIDSGMVIGDDDFVIDEDTSSISNLSDLGSDISVEDNSDYSDTIESFQFGNVKKEELKKVISYMDELLGSLPDSYIKEFASSEYFELYKKIMNELEL